MVGVKETFRWTLHAWLRPRPANNVLSIDQCLSDDFNEMFQRIENRGWIARSSPARSNDKTRCH